MFRQTPEHLADTTKSGDATEMRDLNQAGVKQPQMTTGGKKAPSAGDYVP